MLIFMLIVKVICTGHVHLQKCFSYCPFSYYGSLRNEIFFRLCAVIAFYFKVVRGVNIGRSQAGIKGVMLI